MCWTYCRQVREGVSEIVSISQQKTVLISTLKINLCLDKYTLTRIEKYSTVDNDEPIH